MSDKPFISLQDQFVALTAVLDEVGAYIYTKDLQGRYTYVNNYVLNLFGTTLEETIGKIDRDFFDLKRSNQLRQHDIRVLEHGETLEKEEINFIKPSGEKRIYWTVKKPIRNPEGLIIGMCGISTDITERKNVENRLAEQNHLLETILDNVDAFVYMKDSTRHFLYVNQKTADLFNYDAKAIQGKRDIDVIPEEFADHMWALDKKVFESGTTHSGEETFKDHEGNDKHYWSVKVPYHPDKNTSALVGFSTDITELHELKEQLRLQSNTDSLTELNNRRYFFSELEKELSRTNRHQTPLSILIMDVDHFKSINDKLGHPTGDKVLVMISNILKSQMRKGDTLARVGGEEFAALLPNANLQEGLKLAERIRQAVENGSIGNAVKANIKTSISIGLAQYDHQQHTLESFYALADKMVYKAKESGRNQVAYQ